MKIAGILLFLLGGGLLAIGLVVCIVTLTDDYASSACEKAARDATKFAEAKARCGPTTTDCYKQATVGLTSPEECDYRKSSMNKQLVMGIVPGVLGGFLAFVGIALAVLGFVRARRPRASMP